MSFSKTIGGIVTAPGRALQAVANAIQGSVDRAATAVEKSSVGKIPGLGPVVIHGSAGAIKGAVGAVTVPLNVAGAVLDGRAESDIFLHPVRTLGKLAHIPGQMVGELKRDPFDFVGSFVGGAVAGGFVRGGLATGAGRAADTLDRFAKTPEGKAGLTVAAAKAGGATLRGTGSVLGMGRGRNAQAGKLQRRPQAAGPTAAGREGTAAAGVEDSAPTTPGEPPVSLIKTGAPPSEAQAEAAGAFWHAVGHSPGPSGAIGVHSVGASG